MPWPRALPCPNQSRNEEPARGHSCLTFLSAARVEQGNKLTTSHRFGAAKRGCGLECRLECPRAIAIEFLPIFCNSSPPILLNGV